MLPIPENFGHGGTGLNDQLRPILEELQESVESLDGGGGSSRTLSHDVVNSDPTNGVYAYHGGQLWDPSDGSASGRVIPSGTVDLSEEPDGIHHIFYDVTQDNVQHTHVEEIALAHDHYPMARVEMASGEITAMVDFAASEKPYAGSMSALIRDLAVKGFGGPEVYFYQSRYLDESGAVALFPGTDHITLPWEAENIVVYLTPDLWLGVSASDTVNEIRSDGNFPLFRFETSADAILSQEDLRDFWALPKFLHPAADGSGSGSNVIMSGASSVTPGDGVRFIVPVTGTLVKVKVHVFDTTGAAVVADETMTAALNLASAPFTTLASLALDSDDYYEGAFPVPAADLTVTLPEVTEGQVLLGYVTNFSGTPWNDEVIVVFTLEITPGEPAP